MADRPIIFAGESVLGILADRKTQTRRVIVPQPDQRESEFRFADDLGKWFGICPSNPDNDGRPTRGEYFRCPYGVPGDRLWVREGWKIEPTPGGSYGDAMMARKLSVYYKADNGRRDYDDGGCINAPGFHVDCGCSISEYDDGRWGIWRPPIYMPKLACRLWLELLEVGVERVQDIQGHDLTREGIGCGGGGEQFAEDYDTFVKLWNRLNAKRGHPWSANDWVWRLRFRRIDHD